jgi:hypothetical protein
VNPLLARPTPSASTTAKGGSHLTPAQSGWLHVSAAGVMVIVFVVAVAVLVLRGKQT